MFRFSYTMKEKIVIDENLEKKGNTKNKAPENRLIWKTYHKFIYIIYK